MNLVVLGGSTPFTVALIEELGRLPPGELLLHGRDEAALGDVAGYATGRLSAQGWSVRTATALPAALDGAEIVLHQIRYGDLRGRETGERIAGELGVPADETLGPAGLYAALLAAPPLRALGRELGRRAPGALVLNLTNPLSVTTAVLADAGVPVLGLCELPQATVRHAAQLLRLEAARLEWAYTGLNHRGFLHHLRYDGRDVLDDLAAVLPDRSALGVLGSEVRALRCLPLKYFALFSGSAPHGAGRAARLTAIRTAALSELRAAPGRRPPSLAARPTPWYAEAVAPVLAAIAGCGAADTVVNQLSTGLVREGRVTLDGRRCCPVPTPQPPAAAGGWLDRFDRHERAVLAAVADPTAGGLRAACLADPLLPRNRAADAVRLLTEVAST